MILRGEVVIQSIRVSSYGEGVWPNHHITFIVAKKASFTIYLALFTTYVGGGSWLKMSYRVVG